jgi:hypothetical protein
MERILAMLRHFRGPGIYAEEGVNHQVLTGCPQLGQNF